MTSKELTAITEQVSKLSCGGGPKSDTERWAIRTIAELLVEVTSLRHSLEAISLVAREYMEANP